MSDFRATGRRQVVKIVEDVKHYRAAFYSGLVRALDAVGIDFHLYYSDAVGAQASRGDAIGMQGNYSTCVAARLIGPLLFQELPWKSIIEADGVIAVRGNRLANNYRLILHRRRSGLNLAWWGHAYNYQGNRDSLAESLKRRLAREADWWFSYLPESKDYLAKIGFDCNRVTAVENSISVSEFDCMLDLELDTSLRSKWKLGRDTAVGIYSGSLYREKKLDFLLASVELARQRRPELELIIIGSGPLHEEVSTWAESRPWFHFFGPRYGREKAELYSLSKFVLNPGLVGLSIIDAFGSGRPLVTTNCGLHSPEIGYLRSGTNGLMVEAEVTSYADVIVRLIDNPNYLKALADGARAASQVHTVERMVQGVVYGISKWLERS